MKQPLVSISCITYNQVNYIKDCLDGFLMQKVNFDYEIVLHDDASTDGTRDIIEDYIDRFPNLIYPIFRDTNQYSLGTRHIMARFNFQRCRGKYIAWCDGDDYWTDPHKLQKQVDFLEENPDFTVCFHNSIIVDAYGQYQRHWHRLDLGSRECSMQELIESIYIPTASFMFKNDFQDIPNWLFSLNNGDWGLHLYHTHKGKTFYIAEIMSAYRLHDKSVWSSLKPKVKLRKQLDSVKKIQEALYPEYYEYIQNKIEIEKKKKKILSLKKYKILYIIIEEIKKPLRTIKRKFLRL